MECGHAEICLRAVAGGVKFPRAEATWGEGGRYSIYRARGWRGNRRRFDLARAMQTGEGATWAPQWHSLKLGVSSDSLPARRDLQVTLHGEL